MTIRNRRKQIWLVCIKISTVTRKIKEKRYHEKFECNSEKGSGQAGGHGTERSRVGGAEGDNSECTYMLLVRTWTGQTARRCGKAAQDLGEAAV